MWWSRFPKTYSLLQPILTSFKFSNKRVFRHSALDPYLHHSNQRAQGLHPVGICGGFPPVLRSSHEFMPTSLLPQLVSLRGLVLPNMVSNGSYDFRYWISNQMSYQIGCSPNTKNSHSRWMFNPLCSIYGIMCRFHCWNPASLQAFHFKLWTFTLVIKVLIIDMANRTSIISLLATWFEVRVWKLHTACFSSIIASYDRIRKHISAKWEEYSQQHQKSCSCQVDIPTISVWH